MRFVIHHHQANRDHFDLSGTYTNLRDELDGIDMTQSIADGHIKVFLTGKKLVGGFTLIDAPYGRTKWLQVKERDDYVDTKNDIFSR